MKKEEAAKLIANKTHAIYNDNNNYELLREILSLAFPIDEFNIKYIFNINESKEKFYGYSEYIKGQWANLGDYLKALPRIKLSDIKESSEPTYYDNSKGSIYQFCDNQNLNAWEFDIIKRVVRCRKKGNFIEDLEKTKVLIDLYIKEFEINK
jgi:hypothetical protein